MTYCESVFCALKQVKTLLYSHKWKSCIEKRIVNNKDCQASHWVNLGKKILIKKTWKSQCCHCNKWTGVWNNRLCTGACIVGNFSTGAVCAVTNFWLCVDMGRWWFLRRAYQTGPLWTRGRRKYEQALILRRSKRSNFSEISGTVAYSAVWLGWKFYKDT